MNKKGVEKGFIIAVIIILVTLLILFMWLVKAGYLLGGDYDFRLCQVTIQGQDKLKIEAANVNLGDSPLKINCKRRFIEINNKNILQTYPDKKLRPDEPFRIWLVDETTKKMQPTASYETGIKKEYVNALFADSMKRCWQMVGEGRVDAFNPKSNWPAKNICLVCDQIDIDTDGKILEGNKNPLLWTYLSTTNIPNWPGGDEAPTYRDYLFTEGTAPANEDDEKDEKSLTGNTACLLAYDIDENPDIRTGSYVTIYFRSTARFGLFGRLKQYMTGDLTDSPLKTDFLTKQANSLQNDAYKYNCMNVYVVPATKVRTLCDYVAN